MTIQVAVYVRVSTLNQVQTHTIDQQLQRLPVHIEAQGWQLLDDYIFRDEGRIRRNLDYRPNAAGPSGQVPGRHTPPLDSTSLRLSARS
jgi:hypothetical protein